MYFKDFGGMPWRYFFKERPAFTKDDWFYFVLIHKSGEFFSCSNRQTFNLYPEQALTIEGEEVVEYYIDIDKEKIRIPLGSLIQFFLNHDNILLPWVKKEIETAETGKNVDTDFPEYMPTRIFFTIQKYMADSLYMVSDGASNNAQNKLFDRFNEKLWSILTDEARSEILEIIEKYPYIAEAKQENQKKDTIPEYLLKTFRFFVEKKILIEFENDGPKFAINNKERNPETGEVYCRNIDQFLDYYNESSLSSLYRIQASDMTKYLWHYSSKDNSYVPYGKDTLYKNFKSKMPSWSLK